MPTTKLKLTVDGKAQKVTDKLQPFVSIVQRRSSMFPLLTVYFKMGRIRLNAAAMKELELEAGSRVNFFELSGAIVICKCEEGKGYKVWAEHRKEVQHSTSLKSTCILFIRSLQKKLGITDKAMEKNPQRYSSVRFKLRKSNFEINGYKASEINLGRFRNRSSKN